jgi:hypothetical protein
MSIDNLPPNCRLSDIPSMFARDEHRDVSEDAFDVTLTGEQIELALDALRFYLCEAPGRSGKYLTYQDRQLIRKIEGEMERVVGQ